MYHHRQVSFPPEGERIIAQDEAKRNPGKGCQKQPKPRRGARIFCAGFLVILQEAPKTAFHSPEIGERYRLKLIPFARNERGKAQTLEAPVE
jgi:hypothetical protein